MRSKATDIIKHAAFWLHQHIEGVLMAFFATLLVVDVLLGILSRYVHFEAIFATELGKYLFIWLSCIGVSAAARDNQHIRLNFLVEKLPVPRRVTWIFSQVIFLLMTLFLFYFGIQLAHMHYSMAKTAMGFNYPMFVFTMAIPAGFALCSYRLVVDIINLIGKPDHQPWKTPRT
jgi:TRAP-type C4-dicarboxylate transport system permease small subunit